MSTAINNNPANISTLAVQKTFQLIKDLNDNNELSLEDKMIAIAESLNEINARVDGLETPVALPDIIANSIDTQEIPKIGGCSVLLSGSGSPVTNNISTDFVGQLYIDTTNGKMYFAKGVGGSNNWVLPSTAVVTSWSSTTSNDNVPSEKLVKDSLDNKNDKVTGTSGNLAWFNNNGLLADSGISVSTSWSSSTGSDTKVASEKLVKSAVNDLITEIGNINAFEVVPLTGGSSSVPDVQNPSTKIIYLTKDSGSTATDPYTEWIYSNNTWEVIGETSMDLSGYKTKQSVVSDPTASGTSLTFISNITQNENGVISPSKKTIQDGTTSQKGVVQLENSISTSTTKAATPNSVKSAYDLANSAIPSSSIVTNWSSTTSDSKVPSEKLVKSSLDGKQDTLSFDGTYSSSNKVATVSTVTNAIGSLATVASTGKYTDLSNKPSPSLTKNDITLAPSSYGYILFDVPSVLSVTVKKSYLINITADNDFWVALLVTLERDGSEYRMYVQSLGGKSINGDFGISSKYMVDTHTICVTISNTKSSSRFVQASIMSLDAFGTTGFQPNSITYTTTNPGTSTAGNYFNRWDAVTAAQKIGVFDSTQSGSIQYTQIGGPTTPVYVASDGSITPCTSYSLPYEWVTEVPTNPVAGKIYLM